MIFMFWAFFFTLDKLSKLILYIIILKAIKSMNQLVSKNYLKDKDSILNSNLFKLLLPWKK